MAHDEIRFYLDENLSPEIVTQLNMHGIDIIRGPLTDSDLQHLERASAMRRTLCTEDEDFVRLHESGVPHAGIVKGENTRHSIGTWVKFLRLLHSVYTADETRNSVEYVFETD